MVWPPPTIGRKHAERVARPRPEAYLRLETAGHPWHAVAVSERTLR